MSTDRAARRGTHSGIRIQTFLARLPMFSEMQADELDRIAAHTVPQYYAKGEAIFHQGDPCAGFHIVVYGQVTLGFNSAHGGEKVVEIMGPGQSFGEAVMFLGKPYPVFGRALADTMLLHVGRHGVLEEVERNPPFARRMLAGLARRLHMLVRDVEAYSLRSSTERFIGYLLREAEAPTEVELAAGKSVVASRLNMTPEHFSRVLAELSSAGLIEVRGRTVRILDLERLRRYGA
ncbi:MAG: Crp/Fnr family transcriptional regulator [Burkholderiales bacterium]|nr:Crp/Fnr family transcriptional regulator [Burkholderiales bacterium]